MSTDEDDTLLLKIAEDIADGKAIDWAALATRVDAAALRRMRQIAELAGNFSVAQQAVDAELGSIRAQRGPAKFAHLDLLDEIGRGSSGIVYRAFDPLLQRAVALKLCNPDGSIADDLLREAQQMARIDHPGVLKIHGAQIVDGQVGFWSDLVEGESIAQRLETTTRLPARETVLIGLEICSALAAIHQAGLVHGDVKAQNVVRDRDGQHVLIDFGSARNVHERAQVSGTPLYLAPELLGGGQNTTADDLYSLGVLLFRLLSGRFPVEADSLLGLADAHRSGRRNHLLDLTPQLDSALADCVERAVHPVRAQRFQSAGEFSAALKKCLPGASALEITQRIDEHTQPLGKKLTGWRRSGLVVGLGVALLAALLLFGYQRLAPSAVTAQARLLKASGGVEYPLLNGDAIAVGDVLSMEIELSADAHVYVINEDATGAVFQLFPLPMSELANPLPAGQRLRLPGRVAGRDLDWQVTSPGARERFYVLTSPQPIADLNPANTGFALAEAGHPLDRSALFAAARVTRGVGGLSERVDAAASAEFQVGDWLRELSQRQRGASLQRFELENPLTGAIE